MPEIDGERIAFEYADGIFRGYYYHLKNAEAYTEQLAELEQRITGISSPRIKSAEEAKYQKSTAPPKDNIISLIHKRDELKQNTIKTRSALARLEAFRARLDATKKEIFRLHYMEFESIRTTAVLLGVSQTYCRNLLHEMAYEYICYENSLRT